MSAEETARRVEAVLDRLAAHDDPGVGAAAEELVRVLMDFYGTGLARVLALTGTADGTPPPELLDDECVAGLLVLHGLHPEDAPARIARALRAAGAGDAVVEGFDGTTGALRLSQEDGGCPGTADATRQRIEAALACHAPEVTGVALERTAAAAPLLQIGSGPPEPVPAGAARPGRTPAP
ncbi:hypothetical protein OG422_28365 [Streptomyces sp. NBC_01525]|uniref:hypothetical protein n=1 Tax=Streptomyces sp. NBC_01525 TaxID=2903893 RepID=UPI00386D19D8